MLYLLYIIDISIRATTDCRTLYMIHYHWL